MTTFSDQVRADEVAEFIDMNIRNVVRLAGRWADEREFENIEDYRRAITIPEGFEIVTVTKRPFGFVFRYQGAEYRVSVNLHRGRLSYRRVK